MIEMNAQVSFGSQLQYLPQDSFAQIPLRNSQRLMQINQWLRTFLKRWLILFNRRMVVFIKCIFT